MKMSFARIALGYLAALFLTLSITASGAAQTTGGVRLTGHVPPALRLAPRLGPVADSLQMDVTVELPLQHEAQLQSLIQRLYTPGDPLYGQYLTPAQFAQAYGPAPADYQALAAYLTSQGLQIIGTTPNRLLVKARGPARLVEQAFGVQLSQYIASDGSTVYGPDADPVVPASIASHITAVIGLYSGRRAYSRARILGPINPNQTGPGQTFAPSDIHTAYNLNAVAEKGEGQTLAVIEFEGYDPTDVQAYTQQFGLPGIPLQNILLDGATGVPDPTDSGGQTEASLDVEMSNAMAPNASKLLVYEAPNGGSGWIDILNRMATDNLAKQIGISWGFPEDRYTAVDFNSEEPIFEQMAAQGQSFYAAAGDNGAYDDTNSPRSLVVDDPASDPYVCGVGGTRLSVTNSENWQSETSWNDTIFGSPTSGGGGGISSYWPIPSWQAPFITPASQASSTRRNVPDVSLNADPMTSYAVYAIGQWMGIGGTSASSPLWSAFTALVNQRLASLGKSTLGFPCIPLYTIAGGANYNNDFHDIADGTTNLFYPAVKGYDCSTGLGSFNGANLIADLAGQGTAPPTPPAAPVSLTATAVSSAQINLAWVAGDNTQTSFVVQRKTGAGAFAQVASVSATTLSYQDTGLQPSTTYTYEIIAVNASGQSSPSNQASATTQAQAAPAAPVNLTAFGVSSSQVNLAWVAGDNTQTAFVIQRKTGANPFAQIAIVGANVLTYQDTGLAASTTYTYEVFATNAGGQSQPSNQASGTTSSGTTGPPVPAAPVSLTATTISSMQINLAWAAGDNTQTGFVIDRKSGTGAFAQIAQVSAATLAYADQNLQASTTYTYEVFATNAVGQSQASNQASATTLSNAPAAPINLTATAASSREIDLTWVVVDNKATMFIVQRQSAGGFVTVATTNTAALRGAPFQDTGLKPSTTYVYQVIASNTVGDSAPSNTASATTLPLPALPPTALTATPVSPTQINLHWVDTTGDYSYFIVQRRSVNTSFVTIVRVMAGLTYSDTSPSACSAEQAPGHSKLSSPPAPVTALMWINWSARAQPTPIR
jgi:kumamolisin